MDSHLAALITSPAMKLDDEELIRLAFESTRAQRHGEAIDYLKQAVERSPNNAMAHYLLAAHHAQLGLTERAVEGFNRALATKPDLHPARFQLGMFLLVHGRAAEALAAWQPLTKLDESSAFRHFALGMAALCREDFGACRENLQKGIALGNAGPSLNADMQRVLDEIAARVPGNQSPPQAGDNVLSAYTKSLGQRQ
jgi:tetratricopeptide (TPR) repeat protein